MSSILSHFRAAIEYFNWPLGDMTTKGHIRSLNEAADEIERLRAALKRIANTAGSQRHKQIAREALRDE